jgi:hypothetical protein
MARYVREEPTIHGAQEIAAEIHLALSQQVSGGIQRLAELRGAPYTTVYSALRRAEANGELGLSLSLLRGAHFVSRSPVLERYLLQPGLRAVPDASGFNPASLGPHTAESECGDVLIEAARLLAELRQDWADGRIDRQEDLRLRALVIEIHGHANHIVQMLDQVQQQRGKLRAFGEEPQP